MSAAGNTAVALLRDQVKDAYRFLNGITGDLLFGRTGRKSPPPCRRDSGPGL